ncbi:MAG: hypothetical protein U0869_08445 [Chloroflexota bacterium]
MPTTTTSPAAKTLETSPGFLGKTLLGAIAVLVVVNIGAFRLFYGDTLGSVALPYHEDFSRTTRLDYRQFGGTWRIKDGTLVQSDPALPDQFATLGAQLPTGTTGRFGATLRFTSDRAGGGLLFGMEHGDDRAGSQLVRFGRNEDGTPYLAYGAFDEQLQFQGQGSIPLDTLPESVRLAVVLHPDTYDVQVDEQTVAADVPLRFHGTHAALTTWFSSVVFDDVTLEAIEAPAPTQAAQSAPTPADAPATAAPAAATPDPTAAPDATPEPVAATPPATAALPAITALDESFDGDASTADWAPMRGDWVRDAGSLAQHDTTHYDLAIVHRAPIQDAAIAVRMTQQGSLGAGIVFGLPATDSLKGGNLVRFGPDGALFWGAFDDAGTFTGKGYAQTNVAPGEPHTLEVRLAATSYSIVLDGAELATGVPLAHELGHFGLTTSVTDASFDQVTVQPLSAAVAGTTGAPGTTSGQAVKPAP